MELKAFVKSCIRQREFLLKSGKSKKNFFRVTIALTLFKRHLEFYPKISRENLKRFVSKHKEQFKEILPGQGSTTHLIRLNQLHELLNQ